MNATQETPRPVRIGVLGAAAIAPEALIGPARTLGTAEVVSVAARDQARARSFASRHGLAATHDGYDALLADPAIDAVYIPLPNSHHGHWTIEAIRAGKHVLCEKPFTANAVEARHVETIATASDRVVMEAFHYRYHPVMKRAIDIVESGELGELRHVEAWLQIPLVKRGDIRYRADLAGGATMDVGSYPVHMLRSLTGSEPAVTAAEARLHRRGLDRWMRADFRFGDTTGRMTCSLYGARMLRIGLRAVGDQGELRVFNPIGPQYFHRITVRRDSERRVERMTREPTYRFQLAAFADAVLRDAPILTPPADSVANMTVIDDVYRAAGLEPRQPAVPT